MADEPFDLTLSGGGVSMSLPHSPASEPCVYHAEGSTGLLGAPRSVRFQEGAADGGRWLGTRAKTRPLLIKLVAVGTLSEQRTILSQLRSIVLSEEATLTATVDGEDWSLPVVYESGLEGDYTLTTADRRHTRIDLALTAPSPFWQASNTQAWEWRATGDGLPFVDRLALLPQAASTDDGVRTVTVGGDAAPPCTWTITGPATRISVTVNGRGFTCDGIDEGQSVTVGMDAAGARTITATGVSDPLTLFTAGSVFPRLQKGANTLTVAATGATSSTVATITWHELREQIR